MKKLIIAALGLSLALGTTVALAQDAGSGAAGTNDTTKKKKKKKKTDSTDPNKK